MTKKLPRYSIGTETVIAKNEWFTDTVQRKISKGLRKNVI